MHQKNATKTLKKKALRWLLAKVRKSFSARKMTKSVLSMWQVTIACLPKYQKFQAASHVWHYWSEERKTDQLRKSKEYLSDVSDTFHIPANAGRIPGYQHRERNTKDLDIVLDSIEKSTSGNSQHCTTSSTISFRDPAATAEKEFELHDRTNLPKSVSKCQGNCARPIKVEEVMVVRSYGRITWADKSTGKEKAKFGPMYIHSLP